MICVGIDISKSNLDVSINNKHKKFSNTVRGIEALIKLLPEGAYVIFESTGAYTKMLYKILCDHGIRVCCANPLYVRRFAQSYKMLAKTDKIDAKILALYGEKLEPEPTQFLAETALELNEYSYVREGLMKVIRALKNRLEMPFIAQSAEAALQHSIAALEVELKSIQQSIDAFTNRHDNYAWKVEILTSIPGFGDITAQAILSYCPELGTLNQKQTAALSGLAPRTNQSGKMRGQESIGGGRKRLRNAVYMGAWSAVRCDPKMKALYQGLVQRGKKPKVAITAVMRKLLSLANTLIKNQELFNEGHVWSKTSTA